MTAEELFDAYQKLPPVERRDFNMLVRGFEARTATANAPKKPAPRKKAEDPAKG